MNLTELQVARPELFVCRAPWYIIKDTIQFMQDNQIPAGFFVLQPTQKDNLELKKDFLVLDDKIALSINKQDDIGDSVDFGVYVNILLDIFPFKSMTIHRNIKKINNYLILNQCMAINLDSEVRIFTPIMGK